MNIVDITQIININNQHLQIRTNFWNYEIQLTKLPKI